MFTEIYLSEWHSDREEHDKLRHAALRQVGNMLHPSVPISDNEVSLLTFALAHHPVITVGSVFLSLSQPEGQQRRRAHYWSHW